MEEMELDNSKTIATDEEAKNINLEGNSEGENERVESEEDNDEEDNESEDDADELEIKNLEKNLSENPYDYASHVAIISKLQNIGELEKLRAARENMSSKYPLSPQLWLAWLNDEIKLAVSSEEKIAVKNLCERAVKDYLSVEVWLEYLQFNVGLMGTEKSSKDEIRQLFERALTAAGLHVTKGAIIWEAFREFEIVLVSLASNENDKREQINRVGTLFRRQLACPLLDMEKTWDEYKHWRSDEGKTATLDDSTITAAYQRAVNELNLRLPFEEKLISAQDESELLECYKNYLAFEKEHGDPARVTILFERAVTDLSLEYELWLNYLDYVELNIKIENVQSHLYERVTRNIPWYSNIWIKWLRSLEKWGKSLLEVQNTFESALAVGFPSPEDHRNLWMAYLEYLRRKIDPSSADERKQLEIIQKAFNRACEYLAKSFGLDGDPQCVVLQFWARTEAIHANDMEKARNLWSDIMSQGHADKAASWLEYISLERCYGDTKHLRKLYQKALNSVKDWPESIVNSWTDFERDEGTLEQMEICERKSKEKLQKIAEDREKTQTPGENTLAQSRKATKRKHSETNAKWQTLGASPSKQSKGGKSKVINQEDVSQIDKKVSPDSTASNEDSTNNLPEVDEKTTIFISNLDFTATEQQVREALAPVEPIILFKMVKDFKGRSKGFCYVQLHSPGAVEEALTLDRTLLNGRPMFVSRCDSNKATRENFFKYPRTLEKNKLFVKGLPLTTTNEELKTIFQVYGTLKDVRLVTYRNGHSKGLAYVEFENQADAGKALLATDGMTVGDKVISVALSKPPERKKNSDESFVKSLGSTTQSRTHFGVPKTLLSMIPRNVKPAVTANGIPAMENKVKPMSNQDFRNMLLNKK